MMNFQYTMAENTQYCSNVNGTIRQYQTKAKPKSNRASTKSSLSVQYLRPNFKWLRWLCPSSSASHSISSSAGSISCASLWQGSHGTGISNILETPLETRFHCHMMGSQGLHLGTVLPHVAWPPWLSETDEEEAMIHLILSPSCLYTGTADDTVKFGCVLQIDLVPFKSRLYQHLLVVAF